MDRITQLRIKNVRAFEDVTIDLSPDVTVLIGENGSGKSTIIECLTLLRRSVEPSFVDQLYNIHRGLPGLLRSGAAGLQLGVLVRDDEEKKPPVYYAFALARQGSGVSVAAESLVELDLVKKTSRHLLVRNRSKHVAIQPGSTELVPLPSALSDEGRLAINGLASPESAAPFRRVVEVLGGIEAHVGLDTLAAWASQSIQRPSPMRDPSLLRPADRLSLLGHNLASAWHELKNRPSAHWDETLGLVRLGLGQHVDSVRVALDPGGGHGALYLHLVNIDGPIPAANLSDGQLSWLAYVAMARLGGARSLLAVDEPELHLHPALLGRVISMLTSLDDRSQVVLGTHSDRVLELLDDPADAVRVLSLDGNRALVSRLDEAELGRWLEEFGDLGQIRANGYLPRVTAREAATTGPDVGGAG